VRAGRALRAREAGAQERGVGKPGQCGRGVVGRHEQQQGIELVEGGAEIRVARRQKARGAGVGQQ
jgi:hypothetical protein